MHEGMSSHLAKRGSVGASGGKLAWRSERRRRNGVERSDCERV